MGPLDMQSMRSAKACALLFVIIIAVLHIHFFAYFSLFCNSWNVETTALSPRRMGIPSSGVWNCSIYSCCLGLESKRKKRRQDHVESCRMRGSPCVTFFLPGADSMFGKCTYTLAISSFLGCVRKSGSCCVRLRCPKLALPPLLKCHSEYTWQLPPCRKNVKCKVALNVIRQRPT